MFRRGDLPPANAAVAVSFTRDELLSRPKSFASAVPSWHGLAWVVRVGYLPEGNQVSRSLVLPLGWARSAGSGKTGLDPFAPGAGEKILAELKERKLLQAENRTSFENSVFQSDNGQLTVDAPADTLTIRTARTAGGYAPEGSTINAGDVEVKIVRTDATVWLSSVDGAPIARSKRLIVTHLTDLQNSGARYGDQDRKLLLAWGGLPHLVLDGEATVTVKVANPSKARVWTLSTGGKRGAPVATRVEKDALVIPLRVNAGGRARILYEIEVQP